MTSLTISTTNIPKPEYPRPQLRRAKWMNLNGIWEFEFDPGDSGWERGLVNRELKDRIVVPFVPESQLSGIEDVDFHEAVWYRRIVSIPSEWNGSRILLHFGAVDYDATVWVNGTEVVRHRGGFTPFTADITNAVTKVDQAIIVVRARDSKNKFQARGKQATWYDNSDCQYTRSTGIWQTVWIEPVSDSHILSVDITPNMQGHEFEIRTPIAHAQHALTVQAILTDSQGKPITSAESQIGMDMTPCSYLRIPDEQIRLWSPEDPYLYGLKIELKDQHGNILDSVDSYAGLRSVSIIGHEVMINGKPIFQRLVLDQGYWPQSLMTSPDDEALVRDITLSQQAGFNGARLHQKVFEERYLYHADRLGYLVWGEFGDWGVSTGIGPKGNNQHPTASFITQWIEEVRRDYSHPSIIGWCPLNETYQLLTDHITELDDVTRGMFLAAKNIDPTRPVIDASGYSHRIQETDIYDAHNYEQDPKQFRNMLGVTADELFVNRLDGGGTMSIPYADQPYFISEFGGIWWNALLAEQAQGNESEQSWGYGNRVKDINEFYERFAGLINVLCEDKRHFGYCYTQLTDVFQEQNGLFDFERKPKFNTDRLREIQTSAITRHGRNG